MTDSHAHLTFPQVTQHLETIIDEFINADGKHILNIGYTPESNNQVLLQHYELSNKYPHLIQNALGIHPEYLIDTLSEGLGKYMHIEKVMDTLEEQVAKYRGIISAIGECGLDYYQIKIRSEIDMHTRTELMEQQRLMFRKHVELAVKHKLPLSIHVRDEQGSNNCIEDTLKIISDIGKGQARGSFHSYTQDIQYIPQILSLGFYIGVNGIVTYPKAENVRELVAKIPLEKMLLETDTPLLPPQDIRKNRKFWRNFGAPSDIKSIAEKVGEILNTESKTVIEKTSENYSNLFLVN